MTWSMEDVYEAAVAPADVFRFYADPATWGDWAHITAWGRAIDPIAPDARVAVRIRNYPWTYTVRIRELEDGHRMVSEVRPFEVTITSTCDVRAVAGGARLHHTISLAGPLEAAYQLLTRRQYTSMLHAETRRVAELAASDGSPSRSAVRSHIPASA